MPVNLAPLSASGILVSMRGPPSVLTGLWMPAALGGATGASLAWISEVYAATPIALIGALAIACLGVAVGGLWRPSWRHSPALVAGTLALAIAAPGLGSALPSPPGFSLDAPTWIGMLALFTAGIVSGMTPPVSGVWRQRAPGGQRQ